MPEPIGYLDDRRLPEWGFGITNLVPRPTPGIDTLRPEEYAAGERALRRKIRRVKPEVVAFVGVTLFRAVFKRRPGEAIALGLQPELLEGARVFVLPNPSGRNANFSYAEMLAAFTALRRWLRTSRRQLRLSRFHEGIDAFVISSCPSCLRGPRAGRSGKAGHYVRGGSEVHLHAEPDEAAVHDRQSASNQALVAGTRRRSR